MLCVDEAQRQRVQLGVGLVLAGSNAGGSAGCNAGLRRERRFAFGAVRPFSGVGRGSSRGAGQPVSKHSNAADVAAGRRPSGLRSQRGSVGRTRAASPAAEGPVRMEFEGVAFAYGENLPFVLQDVDVALEPGTVTALVGDSGSGKTTLARLIPRFWDPVSGSVRMNGTELPQMASGRGAFACCRGVPGQHAFASEHRGQHPFGPSRCHRRAGAGRPRARPRFTIA